MAEKFMEHTGLVVPLDAANVDTDAIIPKQFLQKVTVLVLARICLTTGTSIKRPTAKPGLRAELTAWSSILLARENFGCGSSREHAPWALTITVLRW
ncbi:hypothetical protein ACLB1Q_16200 [Escherichia coli]